MEKKKAIVCTALFVVVVAGILVGSIFIQSEQFGFSLYRLIIEAVAYVSLGEYIVKFYKWVMG